MIVRNRAFYMVLDTLMVIFSYIVTSLLREGALPGITPSELWYRCVLVICVYFLVTLFYQVKKESPITISQKRYLNDLIKYHRIEVDVEIDSLTKSEASRMIDQMILVHGRIER